MTLQQIALYAKAGRKTDRQELAAVTVSMMMASRGEEKATKKYIQGLEES